MVEGSFDRRDMIDTVRGDRGPVASSSEVSGIVESAGDDSGPVDSDPLASGEEEAFGIVSCAITELDLSEAALDTMGELSSWLHIS